MSSQVEVKGDEVLDDLILGGLKIIQPQKGYKFSLDAVLLAHFCSLAKVKRVVDLGTGNGIIPLLLSYREANLHIRGVEIQSQMVARARRSVELNHLTEQIEIINLDLKQLKETNLGGYADLVVCNPPFYKPGEGKVSLNQEEAIARHELAISMDEIISQANYVLTSRGKLAIIQRASRLTEIMELLAVNQIKPTRLRLVHAKVDNEAKLVLIEGQKHSNTELKVLPPLIIYQASGEYSDEIKGWYNNKI